MAITELDQKRVDRKIEALDDVGLVGLMFGLLTTPPESYGGHMFGVTSEDAAVTTRTAFLEIAARWIPADVIGPAFDPEAYGA